MERSQCKTFAEKIHWDKDNCL